MNRQTDWDHAYTRGTLRPPTDLGQFYPPRPCKPWVRYSDSLIK